MKNPFLIGDKVYLRPLEQDDGPRLVKWLNDPAIQKTTLRARPLTLEDEVDYITRMRQSQADVAFIIAAKADDVAVGGTAFHQIDWRNRHACFGITIGEPDNWGKGYGTDATLLMLQYAFRTMNLNRVWLQVLEYNERGIRCYEKVGFKKEGLLRQEHFRDGRYWDTHLMAILRADWIEQGDSDLQ